MGPWPVNKPHVAPDRLWICAFFLQKSQPIPEPHPPTLTFPRNMKRKRPQTPNLVNPLFFRKIHIKWDLVNLGGGGGGPN